MHTALVVAPVTAEYVPAEQCVHRLLLLMPGVDDQVPAAHAVQADEPVDALYVPAVHCRHTLLDVAPTLVEYVPAAQLLH